MTRLLVGVAVLAGMLVGGCGSSDEPETTQTDRESDVLERMPEVPAPTEATPRTRASVGPPAPPPPAPGWAHAPRPRRP
jgi:hypothetical protein